MTLPKGQKTRFYIGSTIFIVGLASPLFIPLILNSNLSSTFKTSISGFLTLGIPEIFMAIAVAIMGKEGFNYLKSKLFSYFKPLAPPEYVSKSRYNVGLFMFCLPLFLGWLLPYIEPHFESLQNIHWTWYVLGDFIFLISFFILGGDFWEKFRNLFIRSIPALEKPK